MIALEGSVRASQIGELYAATQHAIENQQQITFDFQKTTDIDASVLQLLIATNEVAGERFLITGVSSDLAATLRRYGIAELPMWQKQQQENAATKEVMPTE